MQPDVLELALVDRRQRLGHAVDERLDADEARARMLRSFGDQMFAAAEAAFQPDLVDTRKQRTQIGRSGCGKIELELRQQRVHQRGLALAQRMALAPAEEGAGWFRFAHDADNSTDLILRRPRSGRLEGWLQLLPMLRDARLRALLSM